MKRANFIFDMYSVMVKVRVRSNRKYVYMLLILDLT